MKEDFLSLAMFTVLAQSATGAYIAVLLSGKKQNTVKNRRIIALILILLVLAAGISFLHLGNPVHAVNAIKNVRTSWLSREILFMCMLIAAIPAYSASINRYNHAAKVLKFISLALALLFLFSMIMVYMLPSVMSWHHPTTPVSFFLTSAICGLMLAGITYGPDAWFADRRYILLTILFVAASLVNSSIYVSHVNYSTDLLLFIRWIAPILAVLILLTGKYRYFSNNYGLWSVIAIVLMFTGELAGRIIFFLSFERSGL